MVVFTSFYMILNTHHLKSTWWYNNVGPILQMNYITWKNQHSKIHIKWDVIYIHPLVCVEPKTCNNSLNMLFEMVGSKLFLFIPCYGPSWKEFLYKLPYDLYLYSWIWQSHIHTKWGLPNIKKIIIIIILIWGCPPLGNLAF